MLHEMSPLLETVNQSSEHAIFSPKQLALGYRQIKNITESELLGRDGFTRLTWGSHGRRTPPLR